MLYNISISSEIGLPSIFGLIMNQYNQLMHLINNNSLILANYIGKKNSLTYTWIIDNKASNYMIRSLNDIEFVYNHALVKIFNGNRLPATHVSKCLIANIFMFLVLYDMLTIKLNFMINLFLMCQDVYFLDILGNNENIRFMI